MHMEANPRRSAAVATMTVGGSLLLVGANVAAGLRESGVFVDHATALMLGMLVLGILLLVISRRLHPVRGGASQLMLWTAGAASLLAALGVQVAPEETRALLQPLFLRCLLLGGAVVALLLFRRGVLARLKNEAGD